MWAGVSFWQHAEPAKTGCRVPCHSSPEKELSNTASVPQKRLLAQEALRKKDHNSACFTV
ncbi:hypothetical protein SUBVAR_07203 [Subdoligranulum variabile DSM 15176]|uniref:Uncharacterized protein n=1 Tax=Subdoligranulum variabile DSM 15176 TaxID=411471 RepID=D1PS20_9FIRM|nr:hypothetical protein SUBVAR_07203 [Subdoligranulum variabile DSM 15176]